MISIELARVGKRFGRYWPIRELTDSFRGGETIGVTGRNGSGKSTLLRLVCGQLTPSRGQITHRIDDQPVSTSDVYQYVSWTGPYLEIAEELTLSQFVDFHFGLKPLASGITRASVLERCGLDRVRNRKITDCSSGMRQRLLLASALYANTPLLLLDEPTVTLDETAIDWFHGELDAHRRDRLVFIASNDEGDLRSVTRRVVL